eukprot:c28606_g1_i6 orf=954-1703(+)
MDTEIESKKRCTFNGDFPLQWGSRKRLRGPKILNTNSGGDDASELSRKTITVGRRVAKANKRDLRAPKLSEGKLTSSCGADEKISRRYCDVSSDPFMEDERSCEPVESSAMGNADTNLLPFLEKSNDMRTEEHMKGCLPASVKEQEQKHDLELLILPKFIIALSRKEKEEDFLAIKGSKLPPRPKKRAKHIQRVLHSVSPGSWLCELSLDRYEVREKKSVRKVFGWRVRSASQCHPFLFYIASVYCHGK